MIFLLCNIFRYLVTAKIISVRTRLSSVNVNMYMATEIDIEVISSSASLIREIVTGQPEMY